MVNRQITLASRPEGFPKESDFALVESDVPSAGPGEVLVRSQWLSLDPYMRGRMSTARSYAKPTEVGEPMTGQAVGEVVESQDPRFAAGDTRRRAARLAGLRGRPRRLRCGSSIRRSRRRRRRCTCSVRPASPPTSASSTSAQAKPGDTVVVSAASGAVGQVVGQLARIAGCGPVVGLAGSAEKVADLTGLYGYDVGIDYKRDDVNARLKEACPNGVDVYFDNVGGALSETVFRRLALGARVPVCGQISQYNLAEPELAPRNLGFLIVFRARLEGFLIYDYVHRFPEGLQRLGRWLAEGKLTYREDVTEGLENAPAAFIGMLNGENRGKTLVKLR